MSPKVRTAVTHAGTALGGGVAVALWAASNSVDLYAIVNQFNVVVTEVSKFVALLTPFATAAYGVYKASTKQKLIDLRADPEFKGAVVSPELAAAVPGPKVVSSVAELPVAAKVA